MSEREPVSTRIARDAYELIEREAEARRTTPAQVARVLLEDAARELQGEPDRGPA